MAGVEITNKTINTTGFRVVGSGKGEYLATVKVMCGEFFMGNISNTTNNGNPKHFLMITR